MKIENILKPPTRVLLLLIQKRTLKYILCHLTNNTWILEPSKIVNEVMSMGPQAWPTYRKKEPEKVALKKHDRIHGKWSLDIVSMLVCFVHLYREGIQPTYIEVIIHLLSTVPWTSQ